LPLARPGHPHADDGAGGARGRHAALGRLLQLLDDLVVERIRDVSRCGVASPCAACERKCADGEKARDTEETAAAVRKSHGTPWIADCLSLCASPWDHPETARISAPCFSHAFFMKRRTFSSTRMSLGLSGRER